MDFSGMLARGLGRAILHLQSHDPVPYRQEILHACTHFIGYDTQLEPSRARYNFDLITEGGDRNWYLPHLYQALERGEDDQAWEQLFALIGLLAQEGDAQARRLLYAVFARDAEQHETIGASELADLDGLNGYVFVARQWLRYPLPEDDHWYEKMLLDDMEEQFGVDAVTVAFAAASVDDANNSISLPSYIANVRERRRLDKEARTVRPRRRPPTYKAMRKLVDAPRSHRTYYGLWSGGKFADQAVRLSLARDLEVETDPDRLINLLHVFKKVPLPLSPNRLLALAHSEDEDTALAAQAALTHITHLEVRALALALAEAGNVWHSLAMLVVNPGPGDYALLAALTDRSFSDDEFHHLGFGIRDYAEAHPSPQIVPALLGLYENGRCTFCRSFVVDQLTALAPLPKAIARELVWDANPDTCTYAPPLR